MSTNEIVHDADDALLDAATAWLRAILVPEDDASEGSRDERDSSEIRRSRRHFDDAVAAGPESRFVQVCDTFGLTAFERDILILLYLQGTNLGIADMCAVRSESDGGWPTFALSLRLAQDEEWDGWEASRRTDSARVAAEPDWRALSPDGPLRRWRIIEISQPGAKPLISSPLRLDERIVNHLKGIDYVDDRIAAVSRRIDCSAAPMSARQQEVLLEAMGGIRALADRSDRVLVQMPGGDAGTRGLFASQIAGGFGAYLYRASADDVLQAQTTGDFVRLWNRECRLQSVILSIDAMDAAPDVTGSLTRLLQILDGVVVLESVEPVPSMDPFVVVDVARPSPGEQRDLWHIVLGDGAGDWPDRLSGQFSLNPADIVAAADLAGEDLDEQLLWTHLRARGRTRMDGLARRITPTTTLDDVQLPAEVKRLVAQIGDQARHRATVYDGYGFRSRLANGLGTTALFEGESGTGKTMAAEALAHQLQLDLYRIDLASVVSKYIGETEKNLKRVFDAAEESSAVLLFDEADAIFGKRSEVQDSHDRYANIEVGYLLQRMEAYEGIAILTTNMKNALDPAFLRRLRFVISFPFPGIPERRRIWAGIFPRDGQIPLVGLDDLDLDALARPPLTGGQIRNIAVNGAFLAAAGDGQLTMERLREAAHDELRKNGRPFIASDYADWESERHTRTLQIAGKQP